LFCIYNAFNRTYVFIKEILLGKVMVMIHHLNSTNGKNAVLAVVMTLQILFFIVCIALIFSQMPVHLNGSVKEQKTERYRSIRIYSGETLWDISRKYYTDEYKNVHSYMKRIMKLNNMSDEDINAGAYLLIPYYD